MWRLFAISSCFSLISAAKILFVSFMDSKSHIGSMLPVAQALSERGHNVTLYVEAYKHLGDFDGIKSHYVILQKQEMDTHFLAFIDLVWNLEGTPEEMINPHMMSNDALTEAVTQDSFWLIANETWDLIVSDEVFTPTGWGLALLHAEKHGTPHIVFSTTDTLHVFTMMLGLHRNPALGPSYYTTHNDPLRWHVSEFVSRLLSVRYVAVEYVSIGIISEWLTRRAIEHIGYFGFSWNQLYQTASLVYVDYPDRFAWPIANGNDLIFVGSFCKGHKALPKDLEDFVSDRRSRGTVYVAFGNNVDWKFAPQRVIDAYAEALNNLTDYRIIWSYNGAQLTLKDHIKIVQWAPQIDLLNHPTTKLFVSHGGLKSLKEAICSETPVVYMPFFAEQTRTSLIARELGFAECLNKLTVDARTIFTRMNLILNNDTFQKSISRQKLFFVDRIAHPLGEGVFWTEKVIRYGRRELFFKRNSMKLALIEIYYLDMCGVILCFIVFLASR